MINVREVTVWVDPKGNVHVQPEVVRISISRGERVLWQCFAGDLEVHFHKDDTPFDSHRFEAPLAAAVVSQIANDGCARETPYKYTVIVTIEKDRLVKDPGVIVEP